MIKVNDNKYYTGLEVMKIINFMRKQYAPYVCIPFFRADFKDTYNTLNINGTNYYNAVAIYDILNKVSNLHIRTLGRYKDLKDMTLEAVYNYCFCNNIK